MTIIVGLRPGIIFHAEGSGRFVGRSIGVTAVSTFEAAYMPYSAKLAAQITAGAYIDAQNKKILEE